jgi:hypothetical protein
MYTVNLKDIKFDQELPDKQFGHADKYHLIDEVSKFVTENHPKAFPNPVTLSRKIDEAIKNADGLTQKESIEYRGEEIMNEIEQQAEVKKAATAPIREKYEKMIAESKEKFDIERRALLEEQIAAREEEVIEAIQLKLDNNTHEAQQDFERLLKEQSEAVASTEAKLEG